MITLKAAKGNFFDRASVTNAVDAASRRVLSWFGAFVRTRAKRSIRRRKRVSAPGQPPASHVGLLKNLIFFSWDQQARSVVIGPTLINRSTGAPETLEYGGSTVIQSRRRSQHVTIKTRPYMRPAFEAEKPGLPAMWRDSVR
jgi:hypothetical protein